MFILFIILLILSHFIYIYVITKWNPKFLEKRVASINDLSLFRRSNREYLELTIMHANPDTDIHVGMKRDGLCAQCARDRGGFVPILPFDFRENSILEGCIENAAEERTREIPLAPLFILRWRRTAEKVSRLPPKISKLFETIRRMRSRQYYSFLGFEASMDNQRDSWNSQTLLNRETAVSLL